jgi:hypothetical protein
MFIINRGVISWKSSKQVKMTNYTIEVEDISASTAKGVWITKFLTSLEWFRAHPILRMFIVTAMMLV